MCGEIKCTNSGSYVTARIFLHMIHNWITYTMSKLPEHSRILEISRITVYKGQLCRSSSWLCTLQSNGLVYSLYYFGTENQHKAI